MSRILVACEYSGVVREAFRKRGHDAWSCDYLRADDESPYHIQGDVLTQLDKGWDMMIAFPPCTYLCSSGLHWNTKRPERAAQTEEALKFVQQLLNANIPKIALENPVGCISSRIRPPNQIIQPYWYGEDASKRTCLWLKNLPLLPKGTYFPGRVTSDGKVRWSNQTDSGQNRLGPSDLRWKERSKTYKGIAEMMAATWSDL